MRRNGRFKTYPRVAICVDRAQAYGSVILRGIAEYVETFGPWSLFIDPKFTGDYSQNWLKNWRGDGVLAYIEDAKLAECLRRAKIPAVEMFGHRYDLGLPQVCTDSWAIGKIAAQHLLERRFTHFTFCGYEEMPWSWRRQQGFVEAVEAAGFPIKIHLLPRYKKILTQWSQMQQLLVDWLKKLPKPNGIMACSDRHAQRLLEACRRANISVPEEIAIIGAGNDEELCRLSDPPLTSVMYDVEGIGYAAAQLLDQILRGKVKAENAKPIFFPPHGVATRRSTDTTAIADRLVADTVRYIREHACDGLGVNKILDEFSISRSAFYRRFQNAIGRSPHEEILRMKLERACNLLSQTELAIERIAEMSGFENTMYLYVAFKREMKMTPRDFRLGAGKGTLQIRL